MSKQFLPLIPPVFQYRITIVPLIPCVVEDFNTDGQASLTLIPPFVQVYNTTVLDICGSINRQDGL